MGNDDDAENNFWGFGMAQKNFLVQVRGVSAGQFIHDTIAHMSPRPKVLIKLDVEGAEYEVLASMLAWGSFRYVDEMWVEWHEEQWAPTRWKSSLGLQESLKNAFLRTRVFLLKF
jgi:hypothetical protein